MNTRIALLGLFFGLTAVTTAAHARPLVTEPDIRDIAKSTLDPVAAQRLRAATGHLADLPDGSFVSRINGRRDAIEARNGMTLTIDGKGFDQRRVLSLAALSAPGPASGTLLKVIDWSDTRIVAVIPADQSELTANTNDARLTVQVVRPTGARNSLEVRGIRFRTR